VTPDAVRAENAARLNRDAVRAMAGRQFAEARRLLEEALSLDAGLVPAWMNLAAVRRAEGDLAGALAAVESAKKIQPAYFPALLMQASLQEAMGAQRQAALSYGAALAQMRPEDAADPATQRAVAHGREFLANYRREMEAYFIEEVAIPKVSGTSAPARRMAGFVDHLMGKRKIVHSSPANFYYPGLPSIEYYDRDDFPWFPELEAATPAIQAELAAVFADEAQAAEIEPYAQFSDPRTAEQWRELNFSPNWSAYHFATQGQLIDSHRQKCPATAATLDRMPQPVLTNRSPAALFSILKPKTHIPPHSGVANFRLICHLPLVLPGNCRLRVGNVIREWKMGEAWVFDDTIEHEAWNDSDRIRTVLIFDIWHPYLSEDEKALITRAVDVVDRFNQAG
jgi:aspartyl/asparaginyl beta-hydroxylase (cupin superfamily)